MSSLRDSLAALPGDALVPVAWVREKLGETDGEPITDLTVAQAAAKLDRSESCVRGWCADGELDAYKFRDREWRIPPEALRAFMRQDQDRPSSDPVNLSSWRQEIGGAS